MSRARDIANFGDGIATADIDDGAVTAAKIGSLPTGSVLQVKTAVKTDTSLHETEGFVDVPGLSVTITPSSASSKILLFANVTFSGNAGLNTGDFRFVLDAGTVGVGVGDASGSKIRSSFSGTQQTGSSSHTDTASGIAEHEPNTTSSVTYKLQMRCLEQNQSGTSEQLYINRSRVESDNANFSRTASALTVMEIAE